MELVEEQKDKPESIVADFPSDDAKKPKSLSAIAGEYDVNPLSFGQQLVGVNFNPSKDARVDRVKALCAELADITRQQVEGRVMETLGVRLSIYNQAVGSLLTSQMLIVKLLTLDSNQK